MKNYFAVLAFFAVAQLSANIEETVLNEQSTIADETTIVIKETTVTLITDEHSALEDAIAQK